MKENCPQCNSEDIKKGVLGASFGKVQMFPEYKRGKSSSISTKYCNKCGYVLSIFVDNPRDIE